MCKNKFLKLERGTRNLIKNMEIKYSKNSSNKNNNNRKIEYLFMCMSIYEMR